MTDHKCKCTHLKSEHANRWYGKPCIMCRCNEYLRVDRPNKEDKISLILYYVLIGLYLIPIFALYEEVKDNFANKYAYSLFICFVGIMLIGIMTVVYDGIFKYYKMKNRRTWEI